ncbi:MAG: MBL fold metallo-hydrolase [Candidatus Bipolaricaulota bacterium]|nr:MBL fold metallo-hydrolase [Candidatus Bipolaricaulota bacterium]MBS3791477.1 MBL fold metallo-hydrolase [Candidatus Bipolaricaulota bacterium]
METNCYVLSSDGEYAVIDPGADADKIIAGLESSNREGSEVKFVLATHFHWDHVEAAADLVNRLKTDFYLGEKDLDLFQQSSDSGLSTDRILKEGDTVNLGSNKLKVWETPGHTPGSISLVEEKERKLLVGDLFFSSGFGRTDLPGGSRSDLEDSLARVVELDGDWEIFPGHGPTFHLEEKLNSSPFLADMRQE